MENKYVGMIFESNFFGKVRIEKYCGNKHVEIYWLDYDKTTVAQMPAIRKGIIRPEKTNNSKGKNQPPPTRDVVLRQCTDSHGDAYDYSETVFGYQKDRITVRCKKHNLYFGTSQSSHTSGSGLCPSCIRERGMKSEQDWRSELVDECMFCNMSIEVVGAWVGVQNSIVKVSCHKGHTRTCTADKLKYITDCKICLTHLNSPLKQIPIHHAKLLADKEKVELRKEKLLEWYTNNTSKATTQFDGKYTYCLDAALGEINRGQLVKTHPIKITCNCGNIFHKSFSYHMDSNYGKGVGCTECADYGYNYKDGSYLYLLTRPDGLFKIGITKNVEQRARQANKNQAVKWNLFWCSKLEGDLRPLENRVMSYLNTIYEKPTGTFDGVTECFILEGNPPVFILKEFVNNF